MTRKMNKSLTIIALVLTLILVFAPCITVRASESYSTEGETSFVFSDSGITVTEGNSTGYKISGTSLTINGSGTYVVSGSCSDGSITVKKGTADVVLILNGLTLTSSSTAPIACNKQSTVTIYVAPSTINTLTDSAYNNDELYTDNADAENAVIKCKDGSQVTISGTGTLNIGSYGKNGIKGGYDLYEEDADGNATDTLIQEAWLTIDGPTININATVNDGLKSDKLLNIYSGNITVTATDDAIKSDYVLNIGKTGTTGPTITVKSAVEGIEGATINVYSGNVTVNASDDGINAANSDLTNYSFSYNQYGGYVYVNVSNGDGLDSNGSAYLYGGTVEVHAPTSGDGDPFDCDSGTTFAGANVLGVGHQMMQQPYTATVPYLVFGGTTGGMGGMGPGVMGGMNGQSTGSINISAGSTITITDSSNNVLYTAKAVRSASYLIFSSSSLTSGSTYTLKVNGTSVATATASNASGGGVQPGSGENPGEMTFSLPFTDVKSTDWYFRAVAYSYENNLMVGTSASTFAPTVTTTRAMVANILYKLAGSPDVTYEALFADVADGQWYTDAVIWAAQNGIYAGYDDGLFHPGDAITREQLVAVLYRYTSLSGGDVSATDDLDAFTDASKVSSWALTEMKWAVGTGIIKGSDSKLNPTGSASRAELAQVLIGYLDDGSYTAPTTPTAGDMTPPSDMTQPGQGGAPSGDMPTPPSGGFPGGNGNGNFPGGPGGNMPF